MVDTLSSYRSPVRLVLHAAEATAPYSAQSLARARKKLMAEIALGSGEVEIDNVVYTRNDAATLLSDISEEAWRVHCLLYTFPGLLNFLEKAKFDNGELKKAGAFLCDQWFVKVVSPFFAHSFNAVSGRFIREGAFEALFQALQYKDCVLPEHQHEAFQKIRTYLDELSYTLRNLSWEKFSEEESILHFVFDESWRKSMNALPPSFNTLRDEIVTYLIAIVLRFQRKATWYYLHQVLVNLRMLETNDFNRHEMARIDEVIYENTQIESRRGQPGKENEITSGRVAWWVIWLVLMFVRMATCNDRSSGYDIPDRTWTTSPAILTNAVEQANEKKLLLKLDSLLAAKPLAVHAEESKPGDLLFPFAEDTRAARNDSLLVVNNTGYDAVFLYFKDIPGHALSGYLPKVYSALIRKGDSAKVYLLPDNGRVYFAFGNDWSKLEKPVSIKFPELAKATGAVQDGYKGLPLDHFFRSGKGIKQRYLLRPLYIGAAITSQGGNTYRNLNAASQSNSVEPRLLLTSSSQGISIEAKGRLMVRERTN